MTRQLAVSILLEVFLVGLTILLLTQPRVLFRLEGERARAAVTMSGLFLLAVTFVWSVIFGCVLALHQLTFRI